MKKFEIDGHCWYTVRGTDSRKPCQFLKNKITGFYHDDYHSGNVLLRNTRKTVEFVITQLKNQFGNTSLNVLQKATEDLIAILQQDLPMILDQSGYSKLTICLIPRAKVEENYGLNQRLFKTVVSEFADNSQNFSNGTNFIFRHTNTKTTHLDRSGYGGDGELPYPGITNDTCTISSEVRGKDILLIDDLYTKDVGIDEDAIQALLNHGANSVMFYSIGKTLK
ncbi:amidophosphoribosyltransferase [Acinetobacter pittii]|uniref:amidophosphoribosyltransferase n=1 Tax=Acinetobacter pittii TaxID=48296 RepID=UPI00083AEF59|nr:amidophosphoribosyltransferase [Acinetobacter pittii]OCZ73681.1 amidophosphoribosyltransferase [Acinetobacter pittii]